MKTRHDGDCTIYASLENGNPEDGICTCGYGWEQVREHNHSQMYSEELQKKQIQSSKEKAEAILERLKRLKAATDECVDFLKSTSRLNEPNFVKEKIVAILERHGQLDHCDS